MDENLIEAKAAMSRQWNLRCWSVEQAFKLPRVIDTATALNAAARIYKYVTTGDEE